MKQKSFLLIFIAVIGLAAYSFGQNYSTIPTDSIHGFISPGGLMDTVLDNFGNKYNLRDIKIDSVKSILGGTQKSTTLISCNSGYFNLYFESGSGMEGTDSVQSPSAPSPLPARPGWSPSRVPQPHCPAPSPAPSR